MNILICDDNTAFAMQLEKDISEYFHNPNMNINDYPQGTAPPIA